MAKLTFTEFCKAAKSNGVYVLLREITEYKDIGTLSQLYAVKNEQLIGCYGDKHGGMIYAKPKKLWSTTRRKFEKVKI